MAVICHNVKPTLLQDVDECLADPSPCGSNHDDMFCYNTRGGYKCQDVTCPEGKTEFAMFEHAS